MFGVRLYRARDPNGMGQVSKTPPFIGTCTCLPYANHIPSRIERDDRHVLFESKELGRSFFLYTYHFQVGGEYRCVCL